MNWLDILLFIIIAISALRGFQKGFVKSFTGLFAVIAGVMVAVAYYRPFSEYLNNQWQLKDSFAVLFKPILKVAMPVGGSDFVETHPLQSIQGSWQGLTERLSPLDFISNLMSASSLEIASFLILVVIVFIGVSLLGKVVSGFLKFSFLGTVDRFGGFLFGMAGGAVWVMVVLAVLLGFQFIGSLLGSNGLFSTIIARSLEGSKMAVFFWDILDAIGVSIPGLPFSLKEVEFLFKTF